MTLEQLLFLLLFLGIPLIERLITAMRRRQDAARPARPAPAVTERVAARKPKMPADVVAQPIPAPVLVPAERTRQDRPATAPSPARAPQALHRGPRRVGLSGAALRVAVVHMAILGPCRALEPRDSSSVA